MPKARLNESRRNFNYNRPALIQSQPVVALCFSDERTAGKTCYFAVDSNSAARAEIANDASPSSEQPPNSDWIFKFVFAVFNFFMPAAKWRANRSASSEPRECGGDRDTQLPDCARPGVLNLFVLAARQRPKIWRSISAKAASLAADGAGLPRDSSPCCLRQSTSEQPLGRRAAKPQYCFAT